MKWVTDPEALKTLMRLRIIKVGDEVKLSYNDKLPDIRNIENDTSQPEYFMRWFETGLSRGGWTFVAWRRPT